MRVLRAVKGWIAAWAAIVLWALGSASFADIPAFNAAVKAGDFGAAAKAAAETWPTLDKTRPDAPIIAREFAFIAMLAKQPTVAEPIARWLAEEGAARDKSGVETLTANALHRWAAAGDGKDKAARKAWAEAIAARAAAPSAGDRVSLAAANGLLVAQWRNEDWKGVAEADKAVQAISSAVGGEGVASADRARMYGLAADFVDDPEADAYLEMVRLYADLVRKSPDAVAGQQANETDQTRDSAYAWSMAMKAYLDSADERATRGGGGPVRGYKTAKIQAKELMDGLCDSMCRARQRAAASGTPMCEVEYVQSPRLTYPQKALGMMVTGAVFLAVETDEGGSVKDVRLLGAVPSDLFPEKAINGVRQWKVRRRGTETSTACTMAGTRTLSVAFMLGEGG